jgi:CheY-like chemotaxis protein
MGVIRPQCASSNSVSIVSIIAKPVDPTPLLVVPYPNKRKVVRLANPCPLLFGRMTKRLATLSSPPEAAEFANAQTQPSFNVKFTVYSGGFVNTDCIAHARGSTQLDFDSSDMNSLCLEEVPVRILVVNDDMRSADSLRHTLTQLGYSDTLIAYSGKRAVAAVANYSPAVALVDLEIADMTGYRLAGLLKGHAIGQVRNIPLIAVAEQASSASAELVRAAGFIALITKPINPSILRGVLSRNLS